MTTSESATDIVTRNSRGDGPDGPPEAAKKVRPPRVTGGRVAGNTVLAVFGVLFIAPLVWLLLASVDSTAGPNLRWPHFSVANFAAVSRGIYIHGLFNSLLISVIATAVATIPAMLAAYVFSRQHIPFKGPLLLGILVLAGVPVSIMIVPLYQVYANHNLLSLLPASVFLGVTSLPFELWIIKNFIDAVPADVEEAARLEQATTAQILLRIVGPLALPGIGAAAIFGFINSWGNFLIPLVLISNSSQQPSPVEMYAFFGGNVIRWGDIAAYSVLYALPVVILYLAMSRLFRGGFVLSGAIKG
jgi:multiple sugar transport system permease protein